MTRMTGPDCAVMCNLINTWYAHTHTLTLTLTLLKGGGGGRERSKEAQETPEAF